jgi:hypothetical protein
MRCAVCRGRGKVHLPKCRIFEDPEVTCSCGSRPCPACEGLGSREPDNDDGRLLLERCRLLSRYPLTVPERTYVNDLSARLNGGHEPRFVDWFRSRELVFKYDR